MESCHDRSNGHINRDIGCIFTEQFWNRRSQCWRYLADKFSNLCLPVSVATKPGRIVASATSFSSRPPWRHGRRLYLCNDLAWIGVGLWANISANFNSHVLDGMLKFCWDFASDRDVFHVFSSGLSNWATSSLQAGRQVGLFRQVNYWTSINICKSTDCSLQFTVQSSSSSNRIDCNSWELEPSDRSCTRAN